MPSILLLQGNSSLPGELISLQNSRYRVVSKQPIQTGDVVSAKLLALGTALSTVYTVDSDESAFAGMKLVSQQVGADTVNRAEALVLTQVFETLTSSFVAEQDDKTSVGEDNLPRITRVLIAEAGTSHDSYVVGTSTYSGLTLANKEVEENDAYVRITLTYGTAGKTETSTSATDDSNVIVITSQNGVPATPSGFQLINTQVVNELGYEGTRYTYAKGTVTIDYELNGLKRAKVVTYYGPSDTPPAAVVGTTSYGSTPTLYLAAYNLIQNDLYKRTVEEYLEPGIVEAVTQQADDGILYVTFRSFYTKVTPTALNSPTYTLTDLPNLAFQGGSAASVFRSRVENVLGYKVYSVTSMMLSNGAALSTSADNTVHSYQTWVQYEKPGLLDVSSSADGPRAYPGNTRWVKANVTEILTKTSTVDNTYKPFSVTEWARYGISYTPSDGSAPVIVSKGAHGYLAQSSVTVTNGTYAGVAVSSAIASALSSPTPTAFYALNNQIIGSDADAAFVTDTGEKWYRKRIITVDGTFGTYLS